MAAGAAVGSGLGPSVAVGVVVLVGLVGTRVLYDRGERRAAAGRCRRRLEGFAPVTPTAAVGPVERGRALVVASAPVRWWAARRAAAERTRLLPEFVDAVARSLSGGSSLRHALAEGGEVVGDPFDADMARLTDFGSAGLSLTQALERWASEVGGDDARLFATACVLGAESGRGTSDALSGVADTLADRRDVAAESRTLTAQARASAGMLVAMPLVLSIGLAFIDPATAATLFASPFGVACLVAGLGLDALGGWWMHRMVRTAAA